MSNPTIPINLPSRALAGTRDPREAIAIAAQKTGVDFDYLLAQARLESGLDPHAKARTSSATGLYQFIDSTWLRTVDRHGERLGLGAAGDAIKTVGGRSVVSDSSARNAIMAMRLDPGASALMAGALANENRAVLAGVLGREADPTELYMAHFLGAGGASKFLRQLATDPQMSAAAILPEAASANRPIFFHAKGGARSVGEVMQLMRGKMAGAMAKNEAEPPRLAHNDAIRSGAQASTDPADSQAGAGEFATLKRKYVARFSRTAASFERQDLPAVAQGQSSMADVLKSSFANAGDAVPARAIAHVEAAYARLKAFDL